MLPAAVPSRGLLPLARHRRHGRFRPRSGKQDTTQRGTDARIRASIAYECLA
jgi:hypothetical protein